MRLHLIILTSALSVIAGGSLAAEPPCPADKARSEQVAAAEAARALAEVKLASEIERADAHAYLLRLELAVTKRELAATLAKCGEPCREKRP